MGRQAGGPPEVGEVHGGRWSGPQFVLTHRRPEDDQATSFLSGDIRDAVEVARSAGGGGNVLIVGADVARQAIRAELVDQIVVHLAPVLLGSGTRFFDCVVGEPIVLEPSPSRAGRIVNLRYRLPARR